MISFLFSSRKKDNPDHDLLLLLKSFTHFTTPEERSKCEFVIKFDEDDDEIEELKKFLEEGDSGLIVKTFTWAQNGGRNSLHEVQSLLYGYIDPKVTWIQVIADDFVFTRPNFVTEILESENNYNYIGVEDEPVTRSIAPCFSRTLLDACCGYFGPQPNADGFSTALRQIMLKKYDIDIGIDIPVYYQRKHGRQSEQWQENHNKIMKDFDVLNIIHQLVSRNVFLCMQEKKNEKIHSYIPNYPLSK